MLCTDHATVSALTRETLETKDHRHPSLSKAETTGIEKEKER